VGPVVVVLVDPCWHSGQALVIAWAEPFESPPVGQGAMAALDLAVGLRPGGAGVSGGEAELGAGVAPQSAAVCRAVVCRHTVSTNVSGQYS